MVRNPLSILLLIFLLLSAPNMRLQAQNDSLPKFSLIERNGWVIIGWNNPYPELTQLIIQRSTDSSTAFRSIMSMPDPTAVSNGYVDKKGGSSNMFYRIFYVQPGGRYTFTVAKKPLHLAPENQTSKTSNTSNSINVSKEADPTLNAGKTIPLGNVDAEKTMTLGNVDPEKIMASGNIDPEKRVALVEAMGRRSEKETKDKTNASLKIENPEFVSVFQPSAFIFSNEEGNLVLLLPEAEKRHYHLHIFKEDGSPLFKMRNIKERHLIVDRSNFYQSGWFRFNLFDGEHLKEKNRFFIPPEGR